MQAYRVSYTEEAARVRDSLPVERQKQLDHGARVLARNPYHKASAPFGADQHTRKALVADRLLIEYVVSHAVMIVVVVEVLDELRLLSDILDADGAADPDADDAPGAPGAA